MTADPTRQPPPSKIAPSDSSNGKEKVDEAAAGRGSLTATSSVAPTAPPTPMSETLDRPTPSLENNRVEVIAEQGAALGSAAATPSTS
jgi:hypothetical protein